MDLSTCRSCGNVLPIKQVGQQTDIVSLPIDPDIRQVADDDFKGLLETEFPVQEIRFRGIIIGALVDFGLRNRSGD